MWAHLLVSNSRICSRICVRTKWTQVVRQRRIEAEKLPRFACEIYEMQMAMGDHFLHEHPAGADSWKTPWVHSLWQDLRVAVVNVHQCVYGCTIKPTRFIGSAWALLEHLSRGCSRDHGHQIAVRLSKAVLCGIDAQRLREGRGPPQPAVRSLRLGTGLYNLSPDARDKPTKVDCAILQDHVKDEEEELQEYGVLLSPSMTSLRVSPSQHVWSRVQERRSARSWKIGECGKRFLCRSDGGGRCEDPFKPDVLWIWTQ